MTREKEVYHQMAKDAVNAGLVVLAALSGFEAVEPGFVSAFFNLNWLVLWVFGASLIAFATHPPSHEKSAGAPAQMLWTLIGLVGAWSVWTWLPADLKLFWRLAASLGALLVALLALSLLKKE